MSVPKDRAKLASHLAVGAEALDSPLSGSQIEQFLIYLEDLKEWNQRVNLTAITVDDEIIEKHFLDSVAGLKAIEKRSGQTMLDVGTGAGFPGLPLKIVFPALQVTLVESSQKKAAFLYHIIGKLHLAGTAVINKRVEKLKEETARYDLIVARAFAKKKVVLERSIALLSNDGKLILYQGRPESASPLDHKNGLETTIQYQLPFSKIRRSLEIYRRKY
ncbi:MAG: 16S rRNA (guanine(527)-N(7))-methyltransferase RsmG [Nitrospirae bacterium]|nr:16S rRNA (guanine(527)-N(7))-methyltransferase RsmG [Nitrospirota bacterium]